MKTKTTTDWEKSFDEKVKELENASPVSEEIVQFGYRYIMKDDGYTIITATATDWGNIKDFIKSQIRKAYMEGAEELFSRMDARYMSFKIDEALGEVLQEMRNEAKLKKLDK